MKMKVICCVSVLDLLCFKVLLPYLHSILQLGNQRVAGDELKEATLHLEGHGHNEGDEKEHLEDEKSEDLSVQWLASCCTSSNGYLCEPERRSSSW
jgi:hypothetical protein